MNMPIDHEYIQVLIIIIGHKVLIDELTQCSSLKDPSGYGLQYFINNQTLCWEKTQRKIT